MTATTPTSSLPTRKRQFAAVLLASSLFLNGCTGTYEHMTGGAVVGGITGAAAGALCCHHPIQDTGRGAIIGIAVGALAGLILDWVDPI